VSRRRPLALLLCAAMLASAGCDARARGSDASLTVVTTTEILADLVHNVGGDRVRVSSIVPSGSDPHSYEPAPADARRVAEADVTFTNHLLLEEHALIKTIDSNARRDAVNVSLAEVSESYGATVIPLVENIGLDVVWLGLAVRGDGKARGATRASDVSLSVSKLEGPGALTIYLTEALGAPKIYASSADGLDGKDTTTLPPGAHTHLNWAFSKPGLYRLTMSARLDTGTGSAVPVGEGTFTFAVGVDPHTAGRSTIVDKGHSDVAVDLDTGQLYAYTDIAAAGRQQAVPADQVVFDVPNRALAEVPNDARFAFLGAPGTSVHQLPQAVLGKHVHGEIDPHLWQDARNAKSYVQLIRDTLVKRDPAGAQSYQDNARAYLAKLDELDAYLREHIGKIPADRRQLISTHDGFGYLAKAYGLTVAGFVVPNPAQQPSAEQVRKLTETIRNLRVPAVFAEHGLAERANVLRQVATDQNVRVCQLYGDSMDQKAKTYLDMMHHNADELLSCLGGEQR
jgi:anchored repeat ABC transporter substrate-binding protein